MAEPQQQQVPDTENAAKRKTPEADQQADKNTVSAEEYQQLKRRRKIEPRGVPWFVMLDRLKQYRDRYGTLNVPSTFRQDPKLASWVQYQRYLFHHKEIAEERKEALDLISFEWSILKPKSGGKKSSWDEQLTRVAAYKEEKGNTLIPYSYALDPSLGFWVSKQRKDYKHGQLSEDKIAKLDAIGFTWKPPTGRRQGSKKKVDEGDNNGNRQSSWEKMFEKLKQFQAVHGSERAHSRSDLNAIDKTLATWIKTQRHMYTIKKMAPDRVAKLELIGFSWRVGQDWKDFYQRLRDYRDRHGNCDFPKQEDARLAAWIDSQRVSYKYRELSKERVDKLKAIGFSFAIDQGLEAMESSAPPVDEDGLPVGMPALQTNPSENELKLASQQAKAGPSQRELHQGDATTKMSEYNIAIQLAGLADTDQGDKGREHGPNGTGVKREDEGTKVVFVDGMEGTGDQVQLRKENGAGKDVGSTSVEDQKVEWQAAKAVGNIKKVSRKAEHVAITETPLNEDEELLKLQEEICDLQAEKVRLQQEKVIVQQEKLSLHREIASLQARNSELTKQATEKAAKDKNVAMQTEANASDGANSKEMKEVQGKARLNDEYLVKTAEKIELQEKTLRGLEKDLSEM